MTPEDAPCSADGCLCCLLVEQFSFPTLLATVSSAAFMKYKHNIFISEKIWNTWESGDFSAFAHGQRGAMKVWSLFPCFPKSPTGHVDLLFMRLVKTQED